MSSSYQKQRGSFHLSGVWRNYIWKIFVESPVNMNEIYCESSSGLSSVRAQNLLYIITATVKIEIEALKCFHTGHFLINVGYFFLSQVKKSF